MSIRRVAALMASALMIVACAAPGHGADAAADRSASPGSSPRTAASPAASVPSARKQILAAYRTYTRLVNDALSRGDAGIRGMDAVTTTRALRDVRARIEANADAGVVTDGRLVPSATDGDIRWGGGDTAHISDCVLNGLSHVATADGELVTQATGTRRPVGATLRRIGGRWVVARARMVQDTDGDNRRSDPPFLRGPMPDGPPSCAPPDIEQAVLAGYRAFWDAFDRAFGFGRDGPANPDDPGLAATSVDPQLSDSKKFFRRMHSRNETSVGQRDERDPWVVALTEFDSVAFVNACVVLAKSRTVKTGTGRTTSMNQEGRIDHEEARMVKQGGRWRISHWTTLAEGISQCESPQ